MKAVLTALTLGAAICLNGCTNGNGTATITFNQVAACNKWYEGPGETYDAGPNQAYLLLKVTSIDNTAGKVDFHWDPTKMYINSGSHPHFDTSTALNSQLLYQKAAMMNSLTVQAGNKNGPDLRQFGFFVVQTANVNGAYEANQTTYYPSYDTDPSGPGVIFQANPQWTPLPPQEEHADEACENIPWQALLH
jgi:hypothetical protein